jgi:hypothetical protein
MDDTDRADSLLRSLAGDHRPPGDPATARARGDGLRARRRRRATLAASVVAILAVAGGAWAMTSDGGGRSERRVDVLGPAPTSGSGTDGSTTTSTAPGPTATSALAPAVWRPATGPLTSGLLAIDGTGTHVVAHDGSAAQLVLSLGDLPVDATGFDAVAADAGSTTAYVTVLHDGRAPSVWRFDAQDPTRTLERVAEDASIPAVAQNASAVAYVAWSEGRGRDIVIRPIDGRERTVRLPEDVTGAPVALAWSPDGSTLLAALVGEDASFLFRIDAAAGVFAEGTAIDVAAGSPSYVNEHEIVATSTDGGGLWSPLLGDLADGSSRALTDLPVARLVAANPRDGRLLLLTVDTPFTGAASAGALLVSDAEGRMQPVLPAARSATWVGIPWRSDRGPSATIDLDDDGEPDTVSVVGGGAGSDLVAQLATGERVTWRYDGCGGGTGLGVAELDGTPIVFHDPCGATVSNARVTAWIDGAWVPVTFPEGDVHGITWNAHSMGAPGATAYALCSREGGRDVVILGATWLVHADGTAVTIDDFASVGGDDPASTFDRRVRVTALALVGSRFEITRTDEGPFPAGPLPAFANRFDCFGATDPTSG